METSTTGSFHLRLAQHQGGIENAMIGRIAHERRTQPRIQFAAEHHANRPSPGPSEAPFAESRSPVSSSSVPEELAGLEVDVARGLS